MANVGSPTGGKITCATSSTDLNHMLGSTATTGCLRVNRWTYNPESDLIDTTAFGASAITSASNLSGLFNGSFDFEAMYPKIVTAASATTPRLGNSGLITFASSSGKVTYAHEYELNFEFGEEDITDFIGTPVSVRKFKPLGLVRASGQWTTRHDSAATLPAVTAVNTGGAAATFKLTEDGTADVAITGSIVIPRGPSFTVDPRTGQIRATYQFTFDGDATAVAGDTLPCVFPAGTIDASDWDTNTDNTPDVTVVGTAVTGQTYTATGFLRSLRIRVAVGQMIEVGGSIRLNGAVS